MTAQEFKNEVLKTDYNNLEDITLPPKTTEKWLEMLQEEYISEPGNTLIYQPVTTVSAGSLWRTSKADHQKVEIYNSDSFDKDYEEWEKDNIETIKFLEFSSVDVKSAREIAEYFYKKALSYGGLV